jgi:chromosomal replication initiation ATPase DnaA
VAGDTLHLKDLPPRTGLAIDDADTISDVAMLLHTLNAAAEARHPVLIAAQRPPARWRTRLPDLASRLRAMTAVEIGQPEESLLQALLTKLLADRQVNVAHAVQDWLLLRLPRSPAVLREAVARLDQASLTAGVPISRSLARRALGDLLGDEETSPDQ